ncbi:transglutaminase family protein [Thioclava litoralis]|uniref:Transglutaminase family protein n=1 Tax=Thioclava litoralis TaxID=3076557 RepID=A0ABZ1E0I4_9RHOB|nr:transglutaminase family protein [Thioclava sp. FTW29]
MFYDLKLVIEYHYDYPTDRARNMLRLMPARLAGLQEVQTAALVVTPRPDERHDLTDYFGTSASQVAWARPVSALRFEVTAKVERKEDPRAMDVSASLQTLPRELAQQASLAPVAPHHFTQPSARILRSPAITAFGQDCLIREMSTLEAIEAIGHALHREMEFDASATTVDTSATEAFTARRGVCQDFAHIMITALRGVGIPAGYVSGFLRTNPPPGQERLEGADAMHAWVRAWAGSEMGWVEFDPTNNQFAGTDYIVVGYGRDYADVAPVRGALRSMGGATTTQAVDVIPRP